MFSLSFSLLVGTALAIDYTPISGSILSDPDGDGYVEVHNGVLAVPQFGGAPVDGDLVASMAASEGDVLVSWGAYRDADDAGTSIDGVVWMMSIHAGEPTLLVAMERDLQVGAEPYGGYWLLATAQRAHPGVTSNPQEWLSETTSDIQAYHQIIVTEIFDSSGADNSESCTGTAFTPGTATLDFKTFSSSAAALNWQGGDDAEEATASFGWIALLLAGCTNECRAGDPYPGNYCQTSCTPKENWCGTCSLDGNGIYPNCSYQCDVDDSCSFGGRGSAPAETQWQ